jgi:hypothetical protein
MTMIYAVNIVWVDVKSIDVFCVENPIIVHGFENQVLKITDQILYMAWLVHSRHHL